jgi:hypothetical protein
VSIRDMTKLSVALTMLLFIHLFLASCYQPPTVRGVVGPLLMVTDTSQWVTAFIHAFFLREEQNVDVGILKLLLSRRPVDLSDVPQSSPFVSI